MPTRPARRHHLDIPTVQVTHAHGIQRDDISDAGGLARIEQKKQVPPSRKRVPSAAAARRGSARLGMG